MKKFLSMFFISLGLFFSTSILSQSQSKTPTVLKAEAPGLIFDGGSTQYGFEGMIEVSSFSDGIQGCVTQGKGCISNLSPFSILIPLSPAVNSFRKAQLENISITNSDLIMSRMGLDGKPDEYYRIHMEDVKVVLMQEGASPNESPMVSIELQPTRIAWKITPVNPNGTPGKISTYGWDFAKNALFNYKF